MSSRSSRLSTIVKVGEDELQVEGVDVAGRVDGAFGVRHGLVPKRANHVHQSVGTVERGLDLRARALAATGAAPGERARDVDELDVGVGDLLRPEERRQPVETFVGHLHGADVQLRLAGVGAGGRMAMSQGIENGRLAGAGKTDDGKLHAFLSRIRGAVSILPRESGASVAAASNTRDRQTEGNRFHSVAALGRKQVPSFDFAASIRKHP